MVANLRTIQKNSSLKVWSPNALCIGNNAWTNSIFAILPFSKDVLYDTYFYAERIMNLSPLEDQKTGGVLMKLANMIVSVSVLSSIFYRWSKEQSS